MGDFDQKGFDQWLQGRPAKVRELAEEWPPTTPLLIDGVTNYIVGYSEGGFLWVSEIDPAKDYEGAVSTRQRICPSCLTMAHPRSG